jgi:hypothetical protein
MFLTVNASLRWLNNVTGVYLVQVSLLLIGQQGLGHFFRILVLASHWLEDCANFTPTPKENDQYSANYSCAIQATSQSAFTNVQYIYNYTPPVISRNDKN